MHDIDSIKLDQDIEIQPYRQEGILSRAVKESTPIIVGAPEVKGFVKSLEEGGYLLAILEDLQSLVDRGDVKLLTASVTYDRFMEFSNLLPPALDYSDWGTNGCNQVFLHFEKIIR